jgi:SOS-response transcriptional repressor LexA
MVNDNRGPVRPNSDNGEISLDAECIADLVGRTILSDPFSPIWEDERFLEWFFEDARRRAERRRTAKTDAQLLADGKAFLARIQARRARVAMARSAPVRRVREPAPAIADAALGVIPEVDLGVAAGSGRELWDEMVDSWIELPPDIPRGRYLALRIVGDSMAPLMHTGDTVLVRLGMKVEQDTVIVARHPDDGYVCKSVVRVTRRRIELASLAPGGPKLEIPNDPALVVGRVVLVWCSHRS